MQGNDPSVLIKRVVFRLFIILIILIISVALGVWFIDETKRSLPLVVVASGIIGGFIGIQCRIKELSYDDLKLFSDSWFFTSISPLVGGILAMLLYLIFLSGLLEGKLFPSFVTDAGINIEEKGFYSIFFQHGVDYESYAKLIFWCFLAGFSERFVIDILNRFGMQALNSSPSIQKNQDSDGR